MKHVFPTLRAARDTLQNGLPGVIEAFNNDPSTTVTLDVPGDDRYFLGGEDPLGGGGGFPSVEIYLPTGSLGPFDLTREHANVDDRVVVVVWAESDRGEIDELYEAVTGYGRCALELLVRDNAFGADVEIANEQGAITYGYAMVPDDPESRDFKKWRAPATLTFKLEDSTDVP